MHSETQLKEIGSMLRLKREEMGISIKEVENSTSIRQAYIDAIEKGLSEQFLSKVYMHGFMRQYAKYLSLDITSYEETSGSEEVEATHDFAYGIGTLESRGSSNGGVKWMPNAMVIGTAVVGMIIVTYLLYSIGLL